MQELVTDFLFEIYPMSIMQMAILVMCMETLGMEDGL